jgi:ribosomal-protein-alanine N-acetyltransferase
VTTCPAILRVVDVVVLETERLILRNLTMGDLDALAALYADAEVRRYFPEGTLTREETREELEWIIDVYYGRYGYGLWATVERETGALIGRCGLLPWKIVPGRNGESGLDGADEYPDGETDVEVEVAYLLGSDHWGRGLGTEAAMAIADHAFNRLHLVRLICLFDPENLRSRKVAENVGFAYERDVELDGELIPLSSLSSATFHARIHDAEKRPGKDRSSS